MKETLFESILKNSLVDKTIKDYEDVEVGDNEKNLYNLREEIIMERTKERAKGFERELKELMNKYKVLGFCCDWDSMSVGFDDGSEYGKWFDVYGEGDNKISVSASTLEIDV